MTAEPCRRIIEEPGDLDSAFLQKVLQTLQPISSFTTTRIGTGQVGEVYRIHLNYSSSSPSSSPSDPATAILKIAAKDPRSRSSGLALGIYERETRFYRDVAPHLSSSSQAAIIAEKQPCPSPSVVPRCHHDAFEPATGAFALVLGDAGAAAEAGDELRGATRAQARLALRELGRLHASLVVWAAGAGAQDSEWLRVGSKMNGEYLRQLFAGFKRAYGDRVEAGHMEICERFVPRFDGYMEMVSTPGRCAVGVYHGDYRLDNMLFSRADGNENLHLTVVDWQLISAGPLLLDVAYFLGGSLRPEDRRAWTEELLQIYTDSINDTTTTTTGQPFMSLEACRRDLRLLAFTGLTMAIVSSMMVGPTARGDDMFMVMLARACEQVRDLDSLDLLLPPPRPDGEKEEGGDDDNDDKTPLRPDPADELPHAPGPERDWNESWYFDFVDAAQGLAGWVRLGLTPNRGAGNWYLAAVTRTDPKQPTTTTTLVVSDFAAPAPDVDLRLRTGSLEATHEVLGPLQKFRVTLRGAGRVFEEAVDSLRGGEEDGRPGHVELDLTYETDGVPYQYRLATRYEIPCRVSGTVRVDDGGGETAALLRVSGVPGQRDHSFGVRDWWAMDWVWSSIHLDDGHHIHATELRLPQGMRMGMGYVQRGGTASEIRAIGAEEELDGDGLTTGSRMAVWADGLGEELVMTIRPMGHTPVMLVSDDGRRSAFDRSWVEVSVADGRRGVGWLEWNRNEK